MSLTIYPLHLGETQVDYSMMVWQKNCGEKTWVPTLAWLILGHDKPILVDTGFRSMDDIRKVGVGARQTEGQTLEAQLAKHKVGPADIGYVIHTHLHLDHCGQTYKFDNAEIFVQRRELQFAAAPLYPTSSYDRVDIARLIGDLWPRLTLLDGDTDVFPGIGTRVTQGHTPAHQMVLVELASGTAVIAGDAAFIPAVNIDQQIPPGYIYNLQAATEELQFLKHQKYVLLTHDIDAYERHATGLS